MAHWYLLLKIPTPGSQPASAGSWGNKDTLDQISSLSSLRKSELWNWTPNQSRRQNLPSQPLQKSYRNHVSSTHVQVPIFGIDGEHQIMKWGLEASESKLSPVLRNEFLLLPLSQASQIHDWISELLKASQTSSCQIVLWVILSWERINFPGKN